MMKRETCITYGAYCAFIFALTFFGPYHGWKYGLIFSVGVTLSMWLVISLTGETGSNATSAAQKIDDVITRRND
jgi:hypothetical protein